MSDDEYVPLELYESQESDSEEVEERNILKKRRGINQEWIYVDMFDDNDAADLWLKNKTKWSNEDTYSTKKSLVYLPKDITMSQATTSTPATSKPTAKPTRKRKETEVTENTDEKPKIGENHLKEDVVDLAKINTTTSYTSFFFNRYDSHTSMIFFSPSSSIKCCEGSRHCEKFVLVHIGRLFQLKINI
ncbi:hypothetical protein BpHYR1_031389 [Brachionus plicatilis]|uniref:Uncharacterized protein n=1 Tax=Brachionus plicatilis TaxID=10195 RepID=A0A3M7S5R1_BRAPC|nr:hypothetical protein BpHYR1_031389 [Brachionus plicatilis]